MSQLSTGGCVQCCNTVFPYIMKSNVVYCVKRMSYLSIRGRFGLARVS
jgi:hypothetical protein